MVRANERLAITNADSSYSGWLAMANRPSRPAAADLASAVTRIPHRCARSSYDQRRAADDTNHQALRALGLGNRFVGILHDGRGLSAAARPTSATGWRSLVDRAAEEHFALPRYNLGPADYWPGD
jgi:hypothetical protein